LTRKTSPQRKNKKERKRLERRQWSYGEIQEDISAIQEEFSAGKERDKRLE
jgi:hypothetical protein